MKIALLTNGLGIVSRGAELFAVEFLNHLDKHFNIMDGQYPFQFRMLWKIWAIKWIVLIYII